MRPGAIHAVYSDLPTVGRGGFMFTFSTMEATVCGLYHMLASSERCSNGMHLEMLGIFRRMVGAVHGVCCGDGKDDIPVHLAQKTVLGEQFHYPAKLNTEILQTISRALWHFWMSYLSLV